MVCMQSKWELKHVADGVNTKRTFQVKWDVFNSAALHVCFYVNACDFQLAALSSLNQISLTVRSSILAQIAVIKVLIEAFHNDNVWIKCCRFSGAQKQQLLLDHIRVSTYMDLNRI